MADTVYILLLNWKGWGDTIACLQSLIQSQGVKFRIIVCDNNSGDGSLERIQDWADGRLMPIRTQNKRLNNLMPVSRPFAIRTVKITRTDVENGTEIADANLILVDNLANLGFAAGNNVGIKLAMQQQDMSHVWILNNDTLVEPSCLSLMKHRLMQSGDQAVCGSLIHFFDQPSVIQAIGGNRFNRVTGIAMESEGRYLSEDTVTDYIVDNTRLDYVSGCSMLLPRQFMEQVGLMNEAYFLYYEEIDWFTRAKGRFPLCVARDARIYHREGQSIGSAGWKRKASRLSDYHMFHSRLVFMRKYYPLNLPVCMASIAWAMLKRFISKDFDNALTVLGVLVGKKWLT